MSEKIPKGWKWVKLGEVAEIVKDIVNPNEFDDLNYIGLEHIGQENLRIISIGKSREVNSTKYLFKPNDILFGKLRPYFRKVVKPKFNGICSTDIWVFRAKQGYDQNYLYYFLANWDFVNLASSGEGGTRMPRADWNYLKQTEWIFPPLPEQKAIAEVLSSIDDKIDLLHRQNKTLEKIAMTLFKQWFIEPTKDGLPEGWEERGLGEIFDYLEGPGIRNWQYSTRGIPFLNIRLIENGEINIKNANFISEEEAFGKYKKFLLQEGDVVISTSGTLGKYAIVRKYHLPLLLNTSIIRFRPKNKNYRIFMYLYLKSREFKEYLESSADGSVQANFGPTHLRAIKIIVPPSHALEKFEKIISPLYEKFDNNFFQIKSLEKLRDTLLPKLMSGEVRVRF